MLGSKSGAVAIWRTGPLPLLLGLLLALFAGPTAGFADKRVALVIGNSQYAYTDPLPNPSNDASDVAKSLGELGFEVQLETNLDKDRMNKALAQFARAAADADVAMFYYAGHGMQYQGHYYLMPVNTELKDRFSLYYEMTRLEDVKSAIENARVRVIVLDSCRNNPLAQRFVRSVGKPTRGAGDSGFDERPREPPGIAVVYAAQADGVANDGSGRNSPFTAAFLTKIKEPGLSLADMFNEISYDVSDATGGQQVPELSMSAVPRYALNQVRTEQSLLDGARESANPGANRDPTDRNPDNLFSSLEAARAAHAKQADAQRAAAEGERVEKQRQERERVAEEARTRERELETKLAAAEAQRDEIAARYAREVENQKAGDASPRAEEKPRTPETSARRPSWRKRPRADRKGRRRRRTRARPRRIRSRWRRRYGRSCGASAVITATPIGIRRSCGGACKSSRNTRN